MSPYEPDVPNEETRLRLIDAATLAFLADGYGAASLDRIARSARISKKTIYKYAESKADLFAAVVENALHAIPTQALVAAADDGDPEAALRQFLMPCAALGLSEEGLRFHWMIMRDAVKFPELLPAFAYALAGFTEGLCFWMESQAKRGRLRIASPAQAASSLLTLLLEETRRGFALGICGAPTPDEQVRIVDYTVDLFLHGAIAGPRDATR